MVLHINSKVGFMTEKLSISAEHLPTRSEAQAEAERIKENYMLR